ncbi:hypothetical protein ACM66B_001440 [Microbotryomycetes sp. NB124-2]
MEFYGITSTRLSPRRPSVPTFSAAAGAGRAASPTRLPRTDLHHGASTDIYHGSTVSISMSRTGSASSTSDLHNTAFLNRSKSELAPPSVPASDILHSPTLPTTPTPWLPPAAEDTWTNRQAMPRRQGPLITRITSPTYSDTTPASTVSDASSPVLLPSSPNMRRNSSLTGRPLMPRRTSGEMSAEDVKRDLAAGGLSAAMYSRMNRSQSSRAGQNGFTADGDGEGVEAAAAHKVQAKRYLDDEDFGDRRPTEQYDRHSELVRFTTPPSEPLTDSQGRKVRNYQLHPGRNRFCFKGRALSSKDNPWPSIISFGLAFTMPVLFFAFSGPFLWHNLSGGGIASIFIFLYLTLIMWTSMCKTSWRDPGIIPREMDEDAKKVWIEDADGPGQGAYRRDLRYIRVKGGVVLSKWCETCHTYRPPRTSHCRLCDNCIEHTDHHCTFLNNCIGRRNYTPFIAFLVSAVLCAIYAISFSAWHIAQRQSLSVNPSSDSFNQPWATRWDVIGSFIVLVMTFALLCPIAALLSYHVRLVWTNRTTIEMLRPKQDRSGAIDPKTGDPVTNVWSVGQSRFKNVLMSLCRPLQVESYVGFREFAVRDVRRSVGDGGGRELGKVERNGSQV